MNGYQSDLKLNDITYVGDFPIENSLGGFGVTTGVTDDFVLTLTPSISQYRTGMPFWVIFNHANTGIPTLNVDGKGAKTIKKVEDGALADVQPGDINTARIIYLVYDGTYLQIVNGIIPTIAQATELIAGIARVATEEETYAGADNSKIITPQKLALYVADKVTGLWENKGLIDCTANPDYPAGLSGDAYTIAMAGKIGGYLGVDVEIRDVVYCITDNPGGDEALVGGNWNVVQANVVQATEAIAGIARIATQAEVNAEASNSLVVTPQKLAGWLATKVATEAVAGIIPKATQQATDEGTDDGSAVTPLKLQVKLDSFLNRESAVLIDALKMNPIVRTTPNRNVLTQVNGNMIAAKDFRFKSNTTIPTALDNTHVFNFPKPLNSPSGVFSGIVFSNLGEQFYYSVDLDGRVTLTGTFNDVNDELIFNINPYLAKYPLEYYPTQPPS